MTLPIPALGVEAFDELIYLVMLGILVATIAFTFLMTRARLGYRLTAVGENEIAARVMGINTTLYKVLAFSCGALFCGFAGATYAYWLSSLDPNVAFDSTYNVLLVIMAFFGGAGTVLGPILGALVLGVFAEWLRNVLVQYHLMVFGIVIIITVVFAPRGLIELLSTRQRFSLSTLLENARENSV